MKHSFNLQNRNLQNRIVQLCRFDLLRAFLCLALSISTISIVAIADDELLADSGDELLADEPAAVVAPVPAKDEAAEDDLLLDDSTADDSKVAAPANVETKVEASADGDDLLSDEDPLLESDSGDGGDELLEGSSDDSSGNNESEEGSDSDSGAEEAHKKVFEDNLYPSANQCASCHPMQYEEWRGSSHAYASVSPMFHKFEQAINDLSQGTIGTFCVRCHASAGTSMGEKRELPIWERSQVGREGVTCITCHRVDESFGKVNGERRIVPGEMSEPMYGPIGGDGVAQALAQKDYFKISTSAGEPGSKIHTSGIKFEQQSKSEFCVSCHQVAVHPGIKLEIVWDQYRASPAMKDGTTCQDCHMSTKPGQPSGYAVGPAAVLAGDKTVNTKRKHSNHAFVGPGYPIAHPGIFPQHPKNAEFTVEEWLTFDYRSQWGNEDFESKVADESIKVSFPADWESADDRVTAREIITSNLAKLEEKRKQRSELMEASSKVEGPHFSNPPKLGNDLDFNYIVTNLNKGHNMPSGSLGAQPEIWLNVALVDPSGKNIWESGYVDSNGDFADLHSHDVRAGKLAHDGQLFNLQAKFLTTNVKGTDREMYLPVNFDVDQIPFIRPANVPTTVLNHPPFIRMENRSIAPLGSRKAKYSVPGERLTQPGKYKLAVRMRSRAEPIYFMKFVGATADMEQAMNQWMLDFHAYTVEFEIK